MSMQCPEKKVDKPYEKDASVPVEWLQGNQQQTPTRKYIN